MKSSVVGSFPKIGDSYQKQKLRRGLESYQQQKISEEELQKIQDEVTREVIETQIKAGIEVITDGQVRWEDPLVSPARKLSGISINGLLRFFDNNVYYRQPVIESAVGWSEPILVRDFQFALKSAPKTIQIKAVLPGPYTLARLCKNRHYSKQEDLVLDLARALAREARALEDAGARLLQFDEPSLPFYPEDFKLAAKALEICVTPLAHSTIYLYTYFSGISKIFDQLSTLPVHGIGVDLASSRENIQLIQEKRFPKDLALGLVDARNTKMEKEEELRNLLESFEKNADHIQFLNPSCGLEFLPYDSALEKLNLVSGLTKDLALRRHS
jgi:5-methyltetrahydropteroyltriglutamate--homocysteine methyltransferase